MHAALAGQVGAAPRGAHSNLLRDQRRLGNNHALRVAALRVIASVTIKANLLTERHDEALVGNARRFFVVWHVGAERQRAGIESRACAWIRSAD
jgi:hypothetical protein